MLYFRDASNPERVAATYIIVLPLSVDFAKYVPPFLAGQVPSLGDTDLTAFAFPPAPEDIGDYERVRVLAEMRGDDLIFGGSERIEDITGLLTKVGEIVEAYSSAYRAIAEEMPDTTESGSAAADAIGSSTDVDDVVYAFMGEADKLGELTKLVGRLRYAREGNDHATAEESAAHIRAIAKHMPENRRVDKLLGAVTWEAEAGSRLAHLYLERAYCLLREDYLRLKSLDEQIEAIESEAT